MPNLVTGGSGFVGAELVRTLVERGEEVVVFDIVKSRRLQPVESQIKVVLGDLHDWPEVFNVIKENHIDRIYHMGSMLTFQSELNPWASFQANVVGTFNILEAARLLNVEKMMFTSSIGTFGELGGEITDTSLQRPFSFYGNGKLYCEGLGRFYRRKFGLDFRGIRYPMVVGPGVSTANHWEAPMIQSAALGKPYKCPIWESFEEPLIYYKDAALAADRILQAPKDRIQMVNYNVGGIQVTSAAELAQSVKKQIPEADITFGIPIPSTPRPGVTVWDDSCAREEWGWQPEYPKLDMMVEDFIREVRTHQESYSGS